MYIRSIKFRDWKAYADAEFTFPEPNNQKNVVLIGAKNGYGKTSLLEGIILGLYGSDGMGILARAFSPNSNYKYYDQFLEKALHAQALEQGRSSISIELVLQDGFERLKISRKWHFNGRGEHKKEDEQIILYEGEPGKETFVPYSGGPSPTKEDKQNFYKSYIGTKFIPMHLAEFFLFDGERVQQLANTDKADMVKLGIEGILGVQTLRSLQKNLEQYSVTCNSKTEQIDDGKLEELIKHYEELNTAVEILKGKKEKLLEDDKNLQTVIAEKQKTLQSMAGCGSKNIEELDKEKESLDRQRTRIETKIFEIIKTKLALALAGKKLRDTTTKNLKAEVKLSEWQYSKNHTQDKLNKLLELFTNINDIVPPLMEPQIGQLKQKISEAWSNLWYPPPTDCASNIKHTYLADKERNDVLKQLLEIEKVGIKEINDLLSEFHNTSKEIDTINTRKFEIKGIDGRYKTLLDEVQGLYTDSKAIASELGACERSLEASKSSINDLKSTIENMKSRQTNSQPSLKRAGLAKEIIELISESIDDLYPKYVEKLSQEMTSIYKKLAHKTVVKKIEISSDCVVKLIGSKGKDLKLAMDSSAGEDQVFALALIAAIAKVSGVKIPIVMDTPLARLDTEHRSNVLTYFSTCPSEQVIFLSQPEEINEEYYKLIKDRIIRSYNVKFEELHDGTGLASVDDGYFRFNR